MKRKPHLLLAGTQGSGKAKWAFEGWHFSGSSGRQGAPVGRRDIPTARASHPRFWVIHCRPRGSTFLGSKIYVHYLSHFLTSGTGPTPKFTVDEHEEKGVFPHGRASQMAAAPPQMIPTPVTRSDLGAPPTPEKIQPTDTPGKKK